MDIKVCTNISNEFQDIEVCINAPERNEEVQMLENELLSKSSKSIQQIIAMQNNDIFIINMSDVILFFSEEKNNFCKTKDGIYKIKEKLYYLEEIITGMEKGSESLVEMGKSYQIGYERIEETFREDKALYGEDYPSEELFLMQLINIFSTNRIMQVYSLSFLIGIALGTIIYIVAVQNIKGKQILIELVIAFVVLFILMVLINLGYETLINKAIQSINPTDVTYSTYIYDIESNNILIPYTIVATVIYAVNMVRQKIITNKLNKQLNTK